MASPASTTSIAPPICRSDSTATTRSRSRTPAAATRMSPPASSPRTGARLIGYPKIDALVNERRQSAAACGRARARSGAADGHLRADVLPRLGAEPCRRGDHRDAARRPAATSSRSCTTARSIPIRATPAASTGAQRLDRYAGPHFLLAASGDSTPFVLASDVMVTDHSSIGFEFCVARSSTGRLRRARPDRDGAHQPGEGRAAPLGRRRGARPRLGLAEAVRDGARLSASAVSEQRARAAGEVFYRPGGATDARAAAGLRAASICRQPWLDAPAGARAA